MEDLKHLFEWCDNHLKQLQNDRNDMARVTQFQGILTMVNQIPKEDFLKIFGRLRKKGKVQVTHAFDDMLEAGKCNFLAIFDHRIVVGWAADHPKREVRVPSSS